jgi:hypothetical protein
MATRKRFTQLHDKNNSKGNDVVQRMQNRQPLQQDMPQLPTRKQVDDQIIDLVLKALYNNGDKLQLSLTKDILDPMKIPYDDKGVDRTWDVLMNSGYVNPVIGFGNEGMMDLSKEGYKVMSQYDGYLNYLKAMQEQPKAPQIIIQTDGDDDEQEKKNITPNEKKQPIKEHQVEKKADASKNEDK